MNSLFSHLSSSLKHPTNVRAFSTSKGILHKNRSIGLYTPQKTFNVSKSLSKTHCAGLIGPVSGAVSRFYPDKTSTLSSNPVYTIPSRSFQQFRFPGQEEPKPGEY